MTSRLTRVGKFEIIQPLGEGAMGEVFLARDTLIGREVALKTIHPAVASAQETRERFLREAQAAGRLNHPNLVSIHEFGEDHGVLFMAMEYVAGDDLGTLMRERTLTPKAILGLLAQVCDGLAYAHQRGVVHRDLKPSNIRVGRSSGHPAAKIMDFGIARMADSELTATGTLLGTLGYMAPEYIQTGKPDARSDLFAVGVILHEALTGAKPFEGDTAATILHRILTEEPPLLDLEQLGTISPAIQGVLRQALAKDPAQRYPSAAALAEALRGAQDPYWRPEAQAERAARTAKALMVPGLPPRDAETPFPGRAVLLAVTALAVAGTLALGARAWLRHRHRPQPVPAPVAVAPPVQPPPAMVPALPAASDPLAQAPANGLPPTSAAVPVPSATTAPAARPEPPKPAAKPTLKGAAKPAYASVDEATADLKRDPEAALAYLGALVASEPGNERAVALRVVALYDAGKYAECARAMGEARAMGHPILVLAQRYPAFRGMLQADRLNPRLPRRRPTP